MEAKAFLFELAGGRFFAMLQGLISAKRIVVLDAARCDFGPGIFDDNLPSFDENRTFLRRFMSSELSRCRRRASARRL